ncbi:syncytin-1-like [Piliocolobus tephrosceles]|uniref:syncytin-1-like n=1 Tax=Piliocolobus tephrosceles TaxID=591936 RepID=UPI000C2A323E|nr:syncytin-1-like [Piliocolobus tephrosceles]
MNRNNQLLWNIILMFGIVAIHAGFDDPRKAIELVQKQHGKPCDCNGGYISSAPTSSLSQVVCSGKTAYLLSDQKWKCKSPPKAISPSGPLKPCPCDSFKQSMHSSCYTEYEQCTSGNKTYYTAVLQESRSASAGGDWGTVQVLGATNKLMQSSCEGVKGQRVCWNIQAPVHISDGGGPQDTVREIVVQKKLEKIHKALYPQIHDHPLALPKTRDSTMLGTQTFEILNATYNMLKASNSNLAEDCWLCLQIGHPLPLAIPVHANYTSYYPSNGSCPVIPPLLVQPMQFSNSSCFISRSFNHTEEIDVGYVTFNNCSTVVNISEPLCAINGSVFVCGNNMAYTYLPQNWTGACVLASLLPDIDIIPGDEPVPIPAIDHVIYRPKRAVQFIPLLAGLEISTAIAAGSTGLGVSLTQYTKLSNQLISDIQAIPSTIQDLQDQVDSLAEVVLQNKRGLDLLTAEQGDICLALQERCCFYANKSGIVRDKIKNLQEDLKKRRKELAANPLLTGFHGLLPYLLPFLGPLLTLLLFLTLGPMIFNKLMAFVKQQIEAFQAKPIQVHYHRLEMNEQGGSHLAL